MIPGSSLSRFHNPKFVAPLTAPFGDAIILIIQGRVKKKLRIYMSMDGTKEPVTARELNCTKCFDELWFCYSPFHQMQQYYRVGLLDNCSGKWNALIDCFNLKTKRSTEVQEILEAREKMKPHIWAGRTREEASTHWRDMYEDENDLE